MDRLPDLVKGVGYLGRGQRPLGEGKDSRADNEEILDRTGALSIALMKSVKQSHSQPSAVKGINPVFARDFGVFGMGLAEFGGLGEHLDVLNELSKTVLGKSITTSSPLATGFVPYDLLAPTKLIYPYYTVLRNKIARTQGQGLSRRLKLITGVSGSHTPAGQNKFQDITTSETTNFGNWPNALPNYGSQTSAEMSIAYKAMIQTEALSWLAQFAGQGFDDVAALLNLILMQEFTLNEEGLMLWSTGTALAAPAVATGAARAAGTGETTISGVVGGNVYVYLTAANEFGETVGSAAFTQAWVAGQVIDVFAAPISGAAYLNVYVGTGAAAPAIGARWYAGTMGGTKFTIQGALPVAGANPPAADTGTSAATRYEGIVSILTGQAVANGVYPVGFQGGYSNRNVGDTLNFNVVANALVQMWNNNSAGGGFRADPGEIIAEGRDLGNLSTDIMKNLHSTAYQLWIQQTEVDNIIAGGAVSQFVNPTTRSKVNLVVHPYLAQGTALLMSYAANHPNANVGALWENVFVQDLMSIKWPVTDMSFRFSVFAYGALVAQAPQYSGILQGLQLSNATPYS